jgi:hypothetical protein
MKMFMPILVLFLFVECINRKQVVDDSIKIERIGPSDKPITNITITLKQIPKAEWQKNIVVTEGSFVIINKFVLSKNSELEKKTDAEHANDPNDWSVFKITSQASDVSHTYIISSRQKSVGFFSDFKSALTPIKDEDGIDELTQQLDILINRIE